MDTILLKYHCLGNDYLVYDTCKNNITLDERAIRTICARNFGLGSSGLLAGPVMDGDRITMKNYRPDGSETAVTRSAARIFGQYLKDAGYTDTDGRTEPLLTENAEKEADAVEEVGKLFLFESFITKSHMNIGGLSR